MKERIGVTGGIAAFILLLFFAWMLAGGSLRQPESGGEMRVVCIKTVDDADSTLLVQDGVAVLIDTGEAQDAPHILKVLASEGVTKLNYLVLTHNDADHIGGAKAILEQIPTEMVVTSYVAHPSELSLALEKHMDEQQIPVLSPTHTKRLRAGGIKMVVYPPFEKNYSQSNNTSLAVLVQHGSVKLFFAGDALRKRSEELLEVNLPQVTLYHVAHHGRSGNATDSLFTTLSPQYAVISASTADAVVRQAAKQCNTQLLFTRINDLYFVSDTVALSPLED